MDVTTPTKGVTVSHLIESAAAAVLGSWALAYVALNLPLVGRRLATVAADELGAAMALWRPWADLLRRTLPRTHRPVVWCYAHAWQVEATLRHLGGTTVLVLPEGTQTTPLPPLPPPATEPAPVDELAARRALREAS